MTTDHNTQRVNFSAMQQQMPYPDFLEIQLKSFQDFVQMNSTPEQRRQEGLYKVFSENFPITDIYFKASDLYEQLKKYVPIFERNNLMLSARQNNANP